MIDFVAFGIVIDDIVLPDGSTYEAILGGGGPQTAWGMAAALGSGLRVGLSACVGADFDPAWLEPLRKAQVNLEGVRQVWQATPRAWQRMAADGGRTHVWRHPPQGRGDLPAVYREARALHWGLHPENPDLTVAQDLALQDKWLSLETFKPPDEALSLAALSELVTSCRIFSPNWREAVSIAGTENYAQLLERFRVAGCHILALRRGELGADVWDLRLGGGVRVPAVPTTVVDAVGAGNAFCGALLARLVTGIGSEDEDADLTTLYAMDTLQYGGTGLSAAACHAVAAASYMVEQFGIPAALPKREDYQRRLSYALSRAEALNLETPP
ncbi:MAG: carbohydrate kinase family protein [Anaerolineae bacterium]